MAEISRDFRREVNRRMVAGLTAIAKRAHEIYREDVTQVTEDPTDEGAFLGPHSQPGEYPHKETGQGEANIEFAVGVENGQPAARFGVRGEQSGIQFPGNSVPGGQHLVHLSHGRHPVTGEFFNRLGMDRTVPDNIDELRQVALEAIRNAD